MIAALGMYDRPELRGPTDLYWSLIRDGLRKRGIKAPEALTRDDRAWWAGWHSPDLLLSQTCGMPYRTELKEVVTLVGTPDFGVEGCPPGYYHSVLVARGNDPRAELADFADAAFAFNEARSQSGWAAAANHMTALGLTIRPALETGGHAASARAVAEGRADWASLDAVTWRLLLRWEPDLAARLRVIGQTAPTPGLPYVTARGTDPAPLAAAVAEAIVTLPPDDRAALGLCGLIQIPSADYLAVPIPPPPALAQG
ncbi:MAG: hypothetical protein BGP11_03400 [Rhodobacterales bacterium 65-51]|uniref:phosphate/phosphite/phosphonate ABC transporter substrate-binding protein n=1 Tax=uncultured Gemmobacter sp. TaxID=1095917 RepID=UPI00095BAC4A|nr:PhnD/SsuA/transferrin family substrate-binding protein [uncultured Gemmobacter sp.]OJY34135.1 MAG: hypothetical protein BGP11_03400 [Rhodobacterales bacterium 65-51]